MPDLGKASASGIHPIIEGIRTMPKPVIAAVNGPAVGIGLSFALACDLVIAAESAYFLLAFVNIGLAPDGGSSFLLPERIGFTRAAEMALLGRARPRQTGAGMGPDQPRGRRQRSDGGDRGAGRPARRRDPRAPTPPAKRQLNAWQFARMADQLELEASLQAELGRSPDFFEGVTAFAEKRPRAILGILTPRREGVAIRPYTAGPRARRTYSPAARGHPGVRDHPACRPRRARGSAVPGGRRLTERGQHQDALRHGLRARAVHLRGRRGHAAVVAVALPRPQGPDRGPDPRQHEARGRLDGRRRRDPDLHHGLHLHQARRRSRTRSRRRSTSTGPRCSPARRPPRPTRASPRAR